MIGAGTIHHEEMTDNEAETIHRYTLFAVSEVAHNPHEARRRLADKLELVVKELRK